jgi:predicted nucleotidyltransferase
MTDLTEIKKFASQIAAQFKPERIILFGSYANGKATADSDVDLLVVMPFKGRPVKQAVKIRLAMDSPFPLDILVRTPRQLTEKLKLGDSFMREVVEQGRVVYEG